PRYMQLAGYEIVPVPVYYPDVTEILGEQVYRKLADIPGELDIISVFRRPSDLPPHLDDILRARPAAVWMQSGIRHRAVAESLAREGIEVVQDRCMMVEHQKLPAARSERGGIRMNAAPSARAETDALQPAANPGRGA